MGVKFHSTGSYQNTKHLLIHAEDVLARNDILHKYGELGVEYLAEATPKRTGKTAASWMYDIENGYDSDKLIFGNTNINKDTNIAIILQYGHGTRFGGYVNGIDYINPASRKAFEQMAEELWAEVTGT